MREIRLYGSEGGGAVRSPYPYQRGRDKYKRCLYRGRSLSMIEAPTRYDSNPLEIQKPL